MARALLVLDLSMRAAIAAVLLALAAASAAAADRAITDAGEETPCREEWSRPGALAAATDGADPALADEPPEQNVEKPLGLLATALADAVHVLSAPIHWSLGEWGLAAASIGTIAALGELGDVHLRYAVQKNKSGVLDDLTKVVEPFGTGYGWAVVGAYGVVGFAFHDQEAKDTAFDAAMSALLSGAITDGLKIIVGRARPEQNLGAAHFDPFGGDKSFPSGHATMAFAVGSVIAAHSDQAWVKASAYSVASLVAFSRVYHDAHWSSDVAAGALIGTAVGETVVRLNRMIRARGSKVSVYAAPILSDGRRGAVLVLAF
jgi:membrane-associated phospholipid phosphatase